MPGTSAPTQIYRAFLRSRWPARTRGLALHAFLGSFILAALDWVFLRAQGSPASPATIAAVRLPWALLAVGGFVAQQLAPGSRLLPPLVTLLSVLWTWGNSWAYQALGLQGTALQAIALLAWLVTVATFLPLLPRSRAAVFLLIWLGHVAAALLFPQPPPPTMRLATEAVVLAFGIIQTLVFHTFATSQRRGILLRQRLERTVVALGASREHAADAVAEVGKLAAAVAHDVNNPLSAVKVNVRWLGSAAAQEESAAERAEVSAETLQAVERIARIVADLKGRAAAANEHVRSEPESEETTSEMRRLARGRENP